MVPNKYSRSITLSAKYNDSEGHGVFIVDEARQNPNEQMAVRIEPRGDAQNRYSRSPAPDSS